MSEAYGIVYLTSRVADGVIIHRYIGQHKLKNGVIEDGYLGSGTLLRRAIKKYGKGVFVREVLELCYDRDSLMDAEIKWILHYNAAESKDFYNICTGGQQSGKLKARPVFKYDVHGKFIRGFESLIEAVMTMGENGLTPSPSGIVGCCRKRASAKSAGGYQWSYEKLDSLPTMERYVAAAKAVEKLDPVTKDVIQEFKSLEEARLCMGCNKVNIFNALNKGVQAKGFYWRYVGEELKKPAKSYKLRPVQQLHLTTLDVITTFPSATEAARHMGCNQTAIHFALSKGTPSCQYRWKYVDSAHGESKPKPAARQVNMLDPTSRQILQVYDHAVAAGDAMGVVSNSIRGAIRTGYKSASHYWEYA
jgi:hypothetical protein